MIMKWMFTILAALMLAVVYAFGQESCVEVTCSDSASDKHNSIALEWSDGTLRWSAAYNNRDVVAPSRLAIATSRGIWGKDAKVVSIKRFVENDLRFKHSGAIVNFGDYSVEIRAYEDGVAYRFIANCEGEYGVVDETAEFSFSECDKAWIPYVNFRADATSDYATQFETSFENTYTYTAIKDIDWRRLIFAPIVVEHNGLKLWISEANLEDYPGMFFSNRNQDGILDTEFAPVPDVVEQGGYNMLQGIVRSRKPHIAECDGSRAFPWRIVAIGENDCDIANSNLVCKLADECRIEDTSWIKSGKVAWEWWNNWGLEGVDFKVGVNTATYKYYIDFASRYGIEYVILDEGWSLRGEADLYKVIPDIDLEEIISYGKERGVGIILWAGYWALSRDIEGLCKHYSAMGVKGFKVDFLDRDDQEMVRFVYDVAEIAAKYHLLIDYHGVYKPTGLQYTYPNAINFEGVHGLETMKWLGAGHDQITYDVTIPFIRGVAGPMDYTPGAMSNASRDDYSANYSRPMSQGTRCHQLAMYILYNQPLAMLCDSPTKYDKEPEFTRFVASIPTDMGAPRFEHGAIGEYVEGVQVFNGGMYIAGLNGNKARSVVVRVDPAFKPEHIEMYVDGDSASEYRYAVMPVEEYFDSCGEIKIAMDAGGGFVIKLRGSHTAGNVE